MVFNRIPFRRILLVLIFFLTRNVLCTYFFVWMLQVFRLKIDIFLKRKKYKNFKHFSPFTKKYIRVQFTAFFCYEIILCDTKKSSFLCVHSRSSSINRISLPSNWFEWQGNNKAVRLQYSSERFIFICFLFVCSHGVKRERAMHG